MFERISEIDREVSYILHKTELGFLLDYIILVPALLCSFVGVPFVIIAFFLKFGQHLTSIYALAVLGGLVLTTTIKRTTQRVRPTKHGERAIRLRWMENNFSFPSGDSYQAGCLAAFLVTVTGNFYFAAIPVLVAFARVYFGFHWVGDTLVGATLGALVTKFGFLRLL